ncbi:MAG: DPP IV N-terminal domain-containing protein [Pseudomonadota bacterium]
MKPILLSALAAACFSACSVDIAGPGNNSISLGSGIDAADAPTELAYVNTLPLERLFQSPSLSGPTPRALAFSPDGTKVTFLKPREEDGARLDLWAFDVATGEASMLVDSTLLEPEEVELSEQEKALRERQRIAGTKGIARYSWGTADTILVPIGGDLYLVELADGDPNVRRLTETDAFEFDAKVSPGGRYVSFIRDGALHAIDLTTGEEQQLSPDAEPENAISFGVAEFVAQEEMSRYTGYWWSPDDKYVAYTRVDESTVDIVPRFDIAADKVTVIEQRYPKAGRPNAIVDVFVRDMETGASDQIYSNDWDTNKDEYLARVDWRQVTAGTNLYFQTVNRDQTELHYQTIALRLHTDGKIGSFIETLWTEEHETWINLSYDFHATGDVTLLSSEIGGYRHILRYDIGETVENETTVDTHITLNSLTRGDWAVSRLVSVVAEQDHFFFTGYKDTPLERHLYRAPLGEYGEPTRITPLGSSWSITMSPDGRSYIGTSSSPGQPPQVGLYKADGMLITWIEENSLDDSNHPYHPHTEDHTVPTFGTLKAEDGQDLYYSIQLPPDFDETKQYPVVIEVYGGPHVQRVSNDWRPLSDQYLTREGYIVFRLDNRGSDNRGRKFENVIYRRTGGPEVCDQLVGVDHLKSLPYVDADRIAIQGWSYGGYMTLMTLLQAEPGTFAAAVSGAPVTDWALYDTFYTERYMDTPQDNPDGYEASSVFPYIDNLEDPLLLIHGMADDNVVFENSTRLMAELQKRGKHFELMTYPGERHGIRGEALQIHLMRTRMEFLSRHLKPKK